MSFKENLRNELLYSGMTVKDLAGKSGLPYQSLKSYVSARNTIPNVEAAVKIARALNVSVEYLVLGEATLPDRKILAVSKLFNDCASLPKDVFDAIKTLVHILSKLSGNQNICKGNNYGY